MIDENDEDEILPATTPSPLPYIQVGMKLRDPLDGTTRWWRVEDIYEHGEAILARLRSSDGRNTEANCVTLRHRWALAEDFDPAWGDEEGR